MTPSPPSAEVGPEVLESIVVDVWGSVGLPVHAQAPADAPAPRTGTASCVHISGAWEGAVVLQLSPEAATTCTAAMFDCPPAAVSDTDVRDAAAELANMVGGNVKSLLAEPSRLSLPTILSAEDAATLRGAALRTRVVFGHRDERFAVTVWQRDTPASPPG